MRSKRASRSRTLVLAGRSTQRAIARSRRASPGEAPPSPDGPTPRPRRLAWSELLQRVFAVDVLECPRCGGRMRLLAAIQPPDAAQAILECFELPTRAPPIAAAVQGQGALTRSTLGHRPIHSEG